MPHRAPRPFPVGLLLDLGLLEPHLGQGFVILSPYLDLFALRMQALPPGRKQVSNSYLGRPPHTHLASISPIYVSPFFSARFFAPNSLYSRPFANLLLLAIFLLIPDVYGSSASLPFNLFTFHQLQYELNGDCSPTFSALECRCVPFIIVWTQTMKIDHHNHLLFLSACTLSRIS